MAILTTKQLEQYLAAPTRCPFCLGDVEATESVDVDNNTASQEIGCLDCDATWRDLYWLVNIEITTHDEEVIDE